MNNWVPKSKIIKIAAVSAVLGAILYFVSLFIVLNKISEIENSYFNADSESSREENFIKIKTIASANEKSIQTLRNFFVKKDDEVKFIEDIEKLASNSNLKFEIMSIDIKPNQDSSFKEDVFIKVTLEGSWSDIIYFVDKLKKMPFGVSIEKMSISANQVGAWHGLMEFAVFREK